MIGFVACFICWKPYGDGILCGIIVCNGGGEGVKGGIREEVKRRKTTMRSKVLGFYFNLTAIKEDKE